MSASIVSCGLIRTRQQSFFDGSTQLLTNGALCVPPHQFVYFLSQPAMRLSLWTNLLEIVCVRFLRLQFSLTTSTLKLNVTSTLTLTPLSNIEFDSVDRLSQGFEEAKLAANSAFKELCEAILRSNSLKDQITDLKIRIATLTSENESLLKRTMDLTQDVSALSAIATKKRYVPVMQRIIWHHVLQQPLLQLPLTIGFNYAPPNFLFNLLGCPQSSTPELISEKVKCLLQILHPDKNPQAPPTASQYIPLVSFAKTILLDKSLSPVYRCCGLDGIARRQHKLRTCCRCDPFLQTLNDLMDL